MEGACWRPNRAVLEKEKEKKTTPPAGNTKPRVCPPLHQHRRATDHSLTCGKETGAQPPPPPSNSPLAQRQPRRHRQPVPVHLKVGAPVGGHQGQLEAGGGEGEAGGGGRHLGRAKTNVGFWSDQNPTFLQSNTNSFSFFHHPPLASTFQHNNPFGESPLSLHHVQLLHPHASRGRAPAPVARQRVCPPAPKLRPVCPPDEPRHAAPFWPISSASASPAPPHPPTRPSSQPPRVVRGVAGRAGGGQVVFRASEFGRAGTAPPSPPSLRPSPFLTAMAFALKTTTPVRAVRSRRVV